MQNHTHAPTFYFIELMTNGNKEGLFRVHYVCIVCIVLVSGSPLFAVRVFSIFKIQNYCSKVSRISFNCIFHHKIHAVLFFRICHSLLFMHRYIPVNVLESRIASKWIVFRIMSKKWTTLKQNPFENQTFHVLSTNQMSITNFTTQIRM